MNETTYEALRSAFETIIAHIRSIDTRLNNAVENLPAILKNLRDRQQKLEDKFDQLDSSNAIEFQERVEAIVDQRIDFAIENYDPAEHIDFDDMISNSYSFDDKVRDAVGELTFTVEVR